MSFTFRKAIREKTSLIIGIAGASGSGKTFSALRLASGLVGPKGRIAFIDTEAGRGLHYADKFDFDYTELTPPFTPARYREAIAAAEEAGYDAILVDSMTHEYEGEGGIVEWAAKLERDGIKSPGNWKVPKTEHKKMVTRLLQCRAHLLFCFRAEEKIRIERVDGKTVVVPIGWTPITEKRFLYEVTTSILMTPDRPGIPVPVKIQEQHLHCFPEGERVGEDTGKLLAQWAAGGAPRDKATIQAAASRAAASGADELQAHWRKLTRPEREVVTEIMEDLKVAAKAADADAAAPDVIDQETGEVIEQKTTAPSGNHSEPTTNDRDEDKPAARESKPAQAEQTDDAGEKLVELLTRLDHAPRGIDIEDIDQVRAYLDGIEAADMGVIRKAMPPEMKDAGREAEASAWGLGHDHVTRL